MGGFADTRFIYMYFVISLKESGSVVSVFFFFRGKGLGSFQNVVSPAALTCSQGISYQDPKYIYSLKSVKTMYIDNWESSSWTLGSKQKGLS